MSSSITKLRQCLRRPYSTHTNNTSTLYTKYNFKPPVSLKPKPEPIPDPESPTELELEPPPDFSTLKPPEPGYRPPSSLDRTGLKPIRSPLPFDFRFSYTELDQKNKPIALREPRYSPFGPDRLDRVWTGLCATVVDPREGNLEVEKELEEKRLKMFEEMQGEPLIESERKRIALSCHKHKTRTQINMGRMGLTHNMLINIHEIWQYDEAARIKCLGVPTVDMKNVCYHLEDKTFGKVIFRRGGTIVLYRGRNYNGKKIAEIPIMLWKPKWPIYPRLLKARIDGLSVQETNEMRERGLAVPFLTKLAKNGYYGNLVRMVQDAFLSDELVRIDCEGLKPSDYKKIGLKLRDLVPCILVTFDKDQIVVWRGKDYKPTQGGYFLTERETVDDTPDNYMSSHADEEEFEDTRS